MLKEEQISNKELATKLDYEQATISKWTTNTIQPPLTTFLRIALLLNRDLKDFFISTTEIDSIIKKGLLKELQVVADQGKKIRRK
ncbi:MAG: helix-turn-helix transcriptional regulator [Chitinophagaceae bacterium]